jgi:hypothetical protein
MRIGEGMTTWRPRKSGLLLAAALAVSGFGAPAATLASAGPSVAAAPTLRLTGLNRAGHVVAVPEAAMLSLPGGSEYYYQGSPLSIPRGSYLIAAEVPTYSGANVTSQTLVYRKVTVGRSETIRLDGRSGRRLRVSLTGATASASYLSASVCMSLYPGGAGWLEGSAWGGPGVAIYAVPVKSRYITFGYADLLTSPAGASYYLIGSQRDQIPARLQYSQRASRLAKLTMELRSGAYGSSDFDWSIQSGNEQSVCGAGENTNTFSAHSWVNYLTPGTWHTSVTAYAQGAGGSNPANAYLYGQGSYRAGRSYTAAFGAAVVGPGPGFPQTAASTGNYARLSYQPYLFYSPVMTGGQTCCDRSVVTLRRGSRVLKRKAVGTGGSVTALIRQSGWYSLDVTDRRWFPGGHTPAGLLSPRVSASFRFHASSVPAGNGSWQYLPLTDARYDALGLNNANQAPAGGTTKLDIRISRPGNAGVASPVYRLKAVRLYLSLNGGASWRRLILRRLGSSWQASISDPESGYVAIRSVVTDVHGGQTEQTVYRAYGVTG